MKIIFQSIVVEKDETNMSCSSISQDSKSFATFRRIIQNLHFEFDAEKSSQSSSEYSTQSAVRGCPPTYEIMVMGNTGKKKKSAPKATAAAAVSAAESKKRKGSAGASGSSSRKKTMKARKKSPPKALPVASQSEDEEEEEEDRSSTKRIPIAQTEHVCISMSPAAVALPAARSSPTREPEGSGPLNLNSQGHTESLLAAAFPVEFGR